MPDVIWTHTFLDVFLHFVPKNVASVLDAGCGRGIVGCLMKIYREPVRIVGIDMFEPYVDFCRKLSVYTDVQKGDLSATPLPFDDGEFDLSVSLEVIEHLPKAEGMKFLTELERVSRQVIISTPTRYFVQEPYDGNPLQQHVSRWRVQDLRQRGYTVFGVGGLTIFGREIPYLSYAFGRLTLYLPQLSDSIMAIYRRDDKPVALKN